jgi:hypothetical protein
MGRLSSTYFYVREAGPFSTTPGSRVAKNSRSCDPVYKLLEDLVLSEYGVYTTAKDRLTTAWHINFPPNFSVTTVFNSTTNGTMRRKWSCITVVTRMSFRFLHFEYSERLPNRKAVTE